MMMIIITRYPASEDRLIARPLLSRVCALRLQPAEPQPYRGSQPAPCSGSSGRGEQSEQSQGWSSKRIQPDLPLELDLGLLQASVKAGEVDVRPLAGG